MPSSLKVAADHVVTIHYTLRDVEGSVRDSSRDGDGAGDGLPYLHGHGNIVPGLEAALEGRGVGDKLTGLHIPPEQGYGLNDPELDLAIPVESFPPEMRGELDAGVQFVAEHPQDDERQVLYTVVGIDGDDVMVTGNHPLAGDILVFDVEILDVRAASADELSHGHVHGPGGHH